MTKLLCIVVVVVAALALAAPHADASVPDPGYSQAGWLNFPGTVLFCPAGDGSYIDVVVKDQFNAPMGGQNVNVNVVIDCPDLVWCSPPGAPGWLPDTTLITDVNGHCDLYFPGAGRHTPDTLCCDISTTIVCLGVTLFDEDLYLTSPDMTQSDPLFVGGLDFSIFALDYLSNSCRCDYDGTPEGAWNVGGLDFSIFALHWLHVCP